MKNIVVPIDFSPASISGLKLAIVVANKVDANVIMIHVQKELTTNEIKDKFAEIVTKHKKLLKKKELVFKIRKGKIYKEISNEAKYNDAMMIVSATHGASGFEELFIGSNAYKMISATECPIMTIRKGVCPKTFSKIILPLDRSIMSRQKVPIACEMAKLFNAELHIIGICDDNYTDTEKITRSYMKQVEGYVKEKGIKSYSEYIKGDNNAVTVIGYAEKVKAELIIAMTEQEKTFSNMLLGSYAAQMVNHSTVPVLFVHPKDKYKSTVFSALGDI